MSAVVLFVLYCLSSLVSTYCEKYFSVNEVPFSVTLIE